MARPGELVERPAAFENRNGVLITAASELWWGPSATEVEFRIPYSTIKGAFLASVSMRC